MLDCVVDVYVFHRIMVIFDVVSEGSRSRADNFYHFVFDTEETAKECVSQMVCSFPRSTFYMNQSNDTTHPSVKTSFLVVASQTDNKLMIFDICTDSAQNMFFQLTNPFDFGTTYVRQVRFDHSSASAQLEGNLLHIMTVIGPECILSSFA